MRVQFASATAQDKTWRDVYFTGGVKDFSNLYEAAGRAQRLQNASDKFNGGWVYRVMDGGLEVWPNFDSDGFRKLEEDAIARIAEEWRDDTANADDSASRPGGGGGLPAVAETATVGELGRGVYGQVGGGVTEAADSQDAADLPSDRPGPSPGSYYGTLSPEPIDVIEGWGLGYNRGNAIKYIARAGRKQTEAASEERDLRKAISYLQREVNRLQGKRAW